MSSTTARRLGDVGASLKCHPARKVEMTPPAGDTPCAKRHVSQTPAPGCITGSRASVGIRREARLVRRGKPMAAIDPQKRLARCFTPQIPARCSTFWCHPCGCPMISTSLVSRQQRTYSLAACCAMHPSTPSRSHCGVQPLQLDAGVGRGEVPVSFGVFLVAAVLPCGDFLGQGLFVGDAPIETLA